MLCAVLCSELRVEHVLSVSIRSRTRSGTECNKIGTSFAAFRDQPDRCGVPLGTCLSNQVSDGGNQHMISQQGKT